MDKLIANEICLASKLRDKIEGLFLEKGECPTGDRNTPLVAYWSLVFEFNRGILHLIESELFGSAFALVRPTIEAIVRAHVILMCSATDLKKLANDEYRTNLATVGKEIDAHFGTDNLFENFLKKARTSLHSYTHAGSLQLGRRFTGSDLVPSYSQQEILEVIHLAASVAVMVNNLATKHLGFEDAWKQNNELFADWAKASVQLPSPPRPMLQPEQTS